jgi:PBP1b-binding outer membrane lipoprotein LpoB
MRKLAILAIFLALTLLVSGCTQSAAPSAATPAPTATAQPVTQGDAAQYLATAAKINAEFSQVEVYLKNILSKLEAAKTPADLPEALSSVSNDLADAKFHVQNAQVLAHELSGYATTPQEKQDSQKILTDLQYLENALTALNAGIEEAQKTSPDIAVMDAKLKECSDWIAKIK